MEQPAYLKKLMESYDDLNDHRQSKVECKALRKALKNRSSYIPNKTINGVLLLIIHKTDKLKYSGPSYGKRALFKKGARVVTCGGRGIPDIFVIPMIGYPPRYPHDKEMTYTNLFRSPVTENSLRGDWEFSQPLLLTLERDYFKNKKAPEIYFSVMDDDHVSLNSKGRDDPFMVGGASLDMRDILLSSEFPSGIFKGLELKKPGHHGNHNSLIHKHIGKLYITYKFTFIDTRPVASPGLLFSRYPVRVGNRLTFFQDAHQDKDAPEFAGAPHPPESCWIELSKQLDKAKHFIFIVGWSVDYRTRLLRHSKDTETLGDFFIRKSKEGVKIYIGVWADMSSDIKEDGVMGTADALSEKFFAKSDVKFKRIARDLWIAGDSLLKEILGAGIFTHHQKVVCMDSECGAQGFVGGLDLTTGRWDDSSHVLFGADQSTHYEDHYQGCLPKAPPAGPRQPWHDVHSRVQGPVASDLISNFVDRMMVEAPEWSDELKELLKSYKNHTHERIYRAGTMHSQVLRSIDSAASTFKGSTYGNLFHGDHIKEVSIQHAYMKNIHRAQKFIYIENQYFIGSSGMWLDPTLRCVRANNNVPRSIVSKIVSKIQAREPFHAYVVIPLFPEGVPETDISQTIIHWQWMTIQAMYGVIGRTLHEENLSNCHPRDYLTFYFPAVREANATNVPSTKGLDLKTQAAINNRRHMIYVHSKLLIVDDDYILLGSANINERSMNGNRDSEIAVHAWNPQQMTTMENYANGEIHHFRANLWREHLGGNWLEEFNYPDTIKCSDIVRQRAELNFQAFAGDKNEELPYGHLCTYPIEVEGTGKIKLREGYENFVDTEACVKGTRFMNFYDALTS